MPAPRKYIKTLSKQSKKSHASQNRAAPRIIFAPVLLLRIDIKTQSKGDCINSDSFNRAINANV